MDYISYVLLQFYFSNLSKEEILKSLYFALIPKNI